MRTFRVNSDLRPSGHLKHLFERAEPTGKSNKTAGSPGHLDLTFMHRVHDNLHES